MLRPEWVKVEDVIRIGADWLRSDDQPVGALLTHHGLGAHAGGGLHVRFAPRGQLAGNTEPEPNCVIVVSLDDYVPGTYDPDTFDRDGAEPMPPFTAEEVDAIAALIEATGLRIIDQWNGAPYRTGSFAVTDRQIAPSLSAAVGKYLASCPEHGHPFCGEGSFHETERDCTWFSGSRLLLVEPVWPVVPYPAPPDAPASDDDRNLDAVRRALRAITPILAEMGIHPATVVAGRRGHIDEHDDGSLGFVPDGGHGVLIPAETAERLVAAAWAAIQADLDR